MTTKLEQAARQVIVDWDSGIHLHEAITALREALDHSGEANEMVAEQAEQEPVAIVNHEAGGSQKVTWLTLEGLADGAELYLHPVRTKDLTDDEIRALLCEHRYYEGDLRLQDFARAVIAADREKNK